MTQKRAQMAQKCNAMATQDKCGFHGGWLPARSRALKILLAAVRFRCLGERVGTTYTRFMVPGRCRIHWSNNVATQGAGPQAPGLGDGHTRQMWVPWGGASRPDPGERGVPPARGGYPPQSEGGGTGPNHTKTSPNGPKMGFGAILDHLEATFIHCGPFEKVEKKIDF